MKRFLFKLILFLAIFVVVDLIAGFVGDFLQANAKGGVTRLTNDFARVDSHDVIIYGSSRAKHHYDTPFMSDTLGLDFYNAGYDGCGVILTAGLNEMVVERYTPKLIIYDVTFGFDIYKNLQDNKAVRYIKWLKPYYKNTAVGKIIKDISVEEWYKVHSGLIRYNPMLQDFIIGSPSTSKGFEPMSGSLREFENSNNDAIRDEIPNVDSLKLKYVEYLIHTAQSKKIPVIFV